MSREILAEVLGIISLVWRCTERQVKSTSSCSSSTDLEPGLSLSISRGFPYLPWSMTVTLGLLGFSDQRTPAYVSRWQLENENAVGAIWPSAGIPKGVSLRYMRIHGSTSCCRRQTQTGIASGPYPHKCQVRAPDEKNQQSIAESVG